MFKKIKTLLVVISALFMFTGVATAEEWLYQKQYLTSHHSINYTGNVGVANLHVIEDVSTASSESAGDGVARYAYCSDVDTGGYQGTYVRRLINDSDYNGNGAKMRAILSSSYPFISLNEMKELYSEQTGRNIDGLTYQEAITGVQAAIWSISNPNHSPYSFGGNISNSQMLKLTHRRIGLTCDWSVTNPNQEGYCYPAGTSNYETNASVAGSRVNSIINWLLSLDGSLIDGTGSVSINVLSKSFDYNSSKDENVAKVSFKINVNNLTLVSSLSEIDVTVTDSNGNEIDVDYSNGVYSFTNNYASNDNNINFDINVTYNSSYGKKAYVYKSEGNQDLVSVENNGVSKNANAKVELKNNHDDKTGEAEISKVAVTGGPELPGAKLEIKDINGNMIDEWISTDKIHVVKGLKEGKYTLTETLAPEGYATATTIEFEIKNGEVTSVEMIDQVTKVLISKKDFTTEEEIEGAKLQIKDSNGNVIHEWISSKEPYYIEKLPVGEYTLIETIYPEGYEEGIYVDGEFVSEYKFKVEDTGEIQTIDVYNRRKDEETPNKPDEPNTKITNVPNTGINSKTTIVGASIMVIGGTVIVIYRKKLNA